jgi:hypothetical protein
MENIEEKPNYYYHNKNGKLAILFTKSFSTTGVEREMIVKQYLTLLQKLKDDEKV